MASLPEPLTPPDLDLRTFDWMPLQVVRLRDSGIVVVASAEAFRAAVLLWCAAWHQVPAASLPKDEKMLCSLAGFGRDLKTWRSLSVDALHGFVECSDGRLYHPVIAEKAIESGSKKRKQGSQTAAATEAARLARIRRDAERNGLRDVDRNGNQERGQDRIGPEKTEFENEREPLSAFDSRDEKDRPTPIDEGYQPSEVAIEYAYSLKMKKVDLDSELNKFRSHCVGLRIASYNPDANFKKWCDQWLDYKRRNEKPKGPSAPSIEPVPLSDDDWRATVKRFKANRSQWSRHAGPEPGMTGCRCPVQVLVDADIDPATGSDMTSGWHFIDHTTNEAAAFMHDAQARKVRAPTIIKFVKDGVEKTGFFSTVAIPPGYDEATGERLAPSTQNEDAA